MQGRILVADDDPKQAELIKLYLERDGYAVVVAHDGREAIEQARRLTPDLAVLDVMMPLVDGLDVCRVLRHETEIPIVMVTARTTEDDMLLGLDLGADDYITKPFSPRELVARIRTVLRRAGVASGSEETLRVGPIELDPARHVLTVAGRQVAVTPKEFAVLHAMMNEPGRAFTRHQLLEAAFGFNYDGLERTIDVHVLNLRKKIESDPTEPEFLLTVYGVGYKVAEDSDVP